MSKRDLKGSKCREHVQTAQITERDDSMDGENGGRTERCVVQELEQKLEMATQAVNEKDKEIEAKNVEMQRRA